MEEQRKKSLTTKEISLQLGCYYYNCTQYGYHRSILTIHQLNGHVSKDNIHNCVPILRPLESISETEAKEVLDLGKQKEIGLAGNYFNEGQLQWLLTRHFDVFGWIEKALAIDATTLEDNPYEKE